MKKTLLSALLAAAALMPATEALAQFNMAARLPILQERESFDMMKEAWSAGWIEVPEASQKDYGIYYFRKDVELAAKPSKFLVYVTGDTRYKLYVNGQLASLGPARNDSKHWN